MWWTASPSCQVLMAEIWGHPGPKLHLSAGPALETEGSQIDPVTLLLTASLPLPGPRGHCPLSPGRGSSYLTAFSPPSLLPGFCRAAGASWWRQVYAGSSQRPWHSGWNLYFLPRGPGGRPHTALAASSPWLCSRLPCPVTHGHRPLLPSSLQLAPSCVTPSARDVPPRTSLITGPRSGSLPSAALISGGSSVSSLWGAHSHRPLALLHP